MSKPHDQNPSPGSPGQIKTMFTVEGNPNVYLVIEERGAMRREDMWFPDVDHAFTWCRLNRCNFVYHPALPNN